MAPDLMGAKIMQGTFFIMDSFNIDAFSDKMYGYLIKAGKLSHNLEDFDPDHLAEYLGNFIVIKRHGSAIRIYQDSNASFGLFYYQKDDYFALSNSFILLYAFLRQREKLSHARDYISWFFFQSYVANAVTGTFCNEIEVVRANKYLRIEDNRLSCHTAYKLPFYKLDRPEALNILDNWIGKNIAFLSSYPGAKKICDVSGGMDSRITLGLALASGRPLEEFSFFSSVGPVYKRDYETALELGKKFGFGLSNNINDKVIPVDPAASYLASVSLKLSHHCFPYFATVFRPAPVIHLMGQGGENLRSYAYLDPNAQAQAVLANDKSERHVAFNALKCLWQQMAQVNAEGHLPYNDPMYLFHSIEMEALNRYHFGHGQILSYLANEIVYAPLMDRTLQQLDWRIGANTDHDLLAATISLRLHPELLDIPFVQKQYSSEVLALAKELNQQFPYAGTAAKIDGVLMGRETFLECGQTARISNCMEELAREFYDDQFLSHIILHYGSDFVRKAIERAGKKGSHHPEADMFKLLPLKYMLGLSEHLNEDLLAKIYSA